MQVKALVGFSGVVTMAKGAVADIRDKVILDDLLAAGYIEKIDVSKPEKLEKPVAKQAAKKAVEHG